jgi:hypothetical protein
VTRNVRVAHCERVIFLDDPPFGCAAIACSRPAGKADEVTMNFGSGAVQYQLYGELILSTS